METLSIRKTGAEGVSKDRVELAMIQALKDQLRELMKAKKAEIEKVEELELYIKLQEEHYSDRRTQHVREKGEMNKRYEE